MFTCILVLWGMSFTITFIDRYVYLVSLSRDILKTDVNSRIVCVILGAYAKESF